MNQACRFNWFDYLKLAEELGGREEESSLRSSMSRAYYYVYHLGLDRAQKNGFVVKQGEGTHTQMWRVFDGSPDLECRKLGEIAKRLKRNRERADYEAEFQRINEQAPQMIADAKDFAARLASLSQRLPSPQGIRS